MKELIGKLIDKHKQALRFLEAEIPVITEIADLSISAMESNGKIIFMGNGGSAADAQHLAAELVGRFKRKRRPLPAIALSVNTSVLTALGNDFGFKEIFSRQIKALASSSDLVFAISTSGNSENVIEAVKEAKNLGLKTIGFLGKKGGKLANLVDRALVIPVTDTAQIQEMHILAGHLICEIIDEHFC